MLPTPILYVLNTRFPPLTEKKPPESANSPINKKIFDGKICLRAWIVKSSATGIGSSAVGKKHLPRSFVTEAFPGSVV